MPSHSHADTEICRSFHLPKTLNARLVEVAASLGVSVAELLRRAIVAMLDRIERGAEVREVPPIAADPPAVYHLPRRAAAINTRSKQRCQHRRT